MKTSSRSGFKRGIVAAMLLVVLSFTARTNAQDGASKEIESTIRKYYSAMATRDSKEIGSVVTKLFLVIEADQKSARTEVIESSDGRKVLPPLGNDDWNPNKLQVSVSKIEVSPTHPSVATALITLKHIWSERQINSAREVLSSADVKLTESERGEIQKRVEAGANISVVPAMLTKQDGSWKIAALAFPK